MFDIGGSHLSAGMSVPAQPNLIASMRIQLPELSSPEAFIDLLETVAQAIFIKSCTSSSQLLSWPLGAAVAVAGPFDYSRGISLMRHKLACLHGYELKQALAARFGWTQEQVVFLNDAQAYLLGELAVGTAQDASRTVGITLGTGIGSAFAIGRHLIQPGDGQPPWQELWNRPYCEATVEEYLSTRTLQVSYARLRGASYDGGTPPLPVEVSAIAAGAAIDPNARECFAVFGRHLGAVLRGLEIDHSPEVVVLGGGIARASPLFLPHALERLGHTAMSIRVSELMDEAPLLGAGVAWHRSKER